MVSCLFQQSDCGLARLVRVCLRGKKGGEMLSEGFGAVGPWSLSCLRMFLGQCSGAISGHSVWQGILVSFYLTLLFDACCEGWAFEKILLRFALRSLVFVASYARLPPRSRFHFKHQRLNFPLQRVGQPHRGWKASNCL